MEYFSNLLDSLASNSRIDRQVADPGKKLGRECYAFSEIEDTSLRILEEEAKGILQYLPENMYSIEYDAIGNLHITLKGTDPSAKKVVVGSHIDSVKDGGIYDGVLGIVAGFDLLKTLVEEGFSPKNDYVVVAFRAEESSPKTGFACLGSAFATNQLNLEKLNNIKYTTDDGAEVQFSEHFIERYGEERWEKVLKELETRKFTPENTLLFEELHIEQSRVLEVKDKDVGIVCGNIGGSERLTVESQNPIESQEINPKEYEGYCVQIEGEEAHTGGAPMNPRSRHTKEKPFYRKDAIIGGAYFINNLIARCQKEGIRMEISEATVDGIRAFTTVPPKFNVRISCHKEDFDDFEEILMDIKKDTENAKQVKCQYKEEDPQAKVLDKKQLWRIFASVFRLEYVARKINKEEVGKVRTTLTDLEIKPEMPVSFKIDVREVDHKDYEVLSEGIREVIEWLRGEVAGVKGLGWTEERNSRSKSHPLTQKITEAKIEEAKKLGLNWETMPSVPGQDALNFAKAGISTGVTFVRHDGISHNPAENVPPESLQNSLKLFKGFIRQVLINGI